MTKLKTTLPKKKDEKMEKFWFPGVQKNITAKSREEAEKIVEKMCRNDFR